MMEAVRTSETSVDNHFTRQYNPEDSSEQNVYHILRNKVLLERYNGISTVRVGTVLPSSDTCGKLDLHQYAM
jgi:hypothetical protein